MPSREEKAWQHYRVDKTLRQARKEIKRNRKRKRVRRKSWVAEDWDEATCTPANWPSYGATLVTGHVPATGWNSIALAPSPYGYALTFPYSSTVVRYVYIASSEHSDTSKRPYWV